MSPPASELNLSPAISNWNRGQVPMYIKKRDIPKFSGLCKDWPECEYMEEVGWAITSQPDGSGHWAKSVV